MTLIYDFPSSLLEWSFFRRTVMHYQLLRGANEDEDQLKYANCQTWYDSKVQNYTRIVNASSIITELFESTIHNGALVEFYVHELMSNYPEELPPSLYSWRIP